MSDELSDYNCTVLFFIPLIIYLGNVLSLFAKMAQFGRVTLEWGLSYSSVGPGISSLSHSEGVSVTSVFHRFFVPVLAKVKSQVCTHLNHGFVG